MATDIEKIKKYWQVADSEWAEWIEKAKKAYRFYLGDQWDDDVKQKLNIEGRPYLTINKIKPVIRNLSGWQRQNRQDLKVLPRRGGDQKLADLYTELLKYLYDASLVDWQMSHAFLDGVICGKGWLVGDIDYTREPLNGDLIISRENPLMVFEDPYSVRYDLSDARFVFRVYWADKDELILQFPKYKKDIEILASTLRPGVNQGVETDDYRGNYASFDAGQLRFLVKECWHRTYKEKKLIINKATLEVKETNESDEKLERLVANFPDLVYVRRIIPVLNLTTLVGDVVLQDIEDPFNGITDFPLVRYCAEFIYSDKINIKGEVEDLIDPQMELNKRRSQALHILNTSANSGWIVEENALAPEERRKLETLGSKPGVIITVRSGKKGGIERITPVPLSEGHIALDKLAEDDIKKISGVNADLLGFAPEKHESGIAMQLRQRQGLITTEQLFDNFEYTQRILGNLLLEFIRKTDILSEEEIFYIASKKNIEGTTPEVLKSRARGKYSVILVTKDSSPSVRLANFYAMLDAIKAGIQIPEEMVIQASDFPFKEELLERIRMQKEGIPQQPQGIPQNIPPGVGGLPINVGGV